MGWIALSFLVGLLAGIFWWKYHTLPAGFASYIHPEIGRESTEGRFHTLKARLEELEARLQRLEAQNAGKIAQPTGGWEDGLEEEGAEFSERGEGSSWQEELRKGASQPGTPPEEASQGLHEQQQREEHMGEDIRMEEVVPSAEFKEGKRRERVFKMWQEGKEVEQIMKETGIGRGEVDLILTLRRKEYGSAPH